MKPFVNSGILLILKVLLDAGGDSAMENNYGYTPMERG